MYTYVTRLCNRFFPEKKCATNVRITTLIKKEKGYYVRNKMLHVNTDSNANEI